MVRDGRMVDGSGEQWLDRGKDGPCIVSPVTDRSLILPNQLLMSEQATYNLSSEVGSRSFSKDKEATRF